MTAKVSDDPVTHDAKEMVHEEKDTNRFTVFLSFISNILLTNHRNNSVRLVICNMTFVQSFAMITFKMNR